MRLHRPGAYGISILRMVHIMESLCVLAAMHVTWPRFQQDSFARHPICKTGLRGLQKIVSKPAEMVWREVKIHSQTRQRPDGRFATPALST